MKTRISELFGIKHPIIQSPMASMAHSIIGLSIALGLIVWHTVLWNNNGTHEAMISWAGSLKAYLAVLYNLALMLVTSALLGTLMGKITEMVSRFLNKK